MTKYCYIFLSLQLTSARVEHDTHRGLRREIVRGRADCLDPNNHSAASDGWRDARRVVPAVRQTGRRLGRHDPFSFKLRGKWNKTLLVSHMLKTVFKGGAADLHVPATRYDSAKCRWKLQRVECLASRARATCSCSRTCYPLSKRIRIETGNNDQIL